MKVITSFKKYCHWGGKDPINVTDFVESNYQLGRWVSIAFI